MTQIKHIIRADSVVFFFEDSESFVILACGEASKFEEVELRATEAYLEHRENPQPLIDASEIIS